MTLDELRRRIDGLDVEIVRLLNRRAAVAVQIGEEKRRQEMSSVRDPAREREVIERAQSNNTGPLTGGGVERIYREIIEACSEIQERA